MNIRNHDLRTTEGRVLHCAGVHIEEIVTIFGLKDTKTTLHFHGLYKEDVGKAMQKLAHRRKYLAIASEMVDGSGFEPETS